MADGPWTKYAAPQQDGPWTKYAQPQPESSPVGDYLARTGSNLYNAGKSVVSGVQDIVNSSDPLTEIANKAGGMATSVAQGVNDATGRAWKSADQVAAGHWSELPAMVQHQAGMVPFAGPVDEAMERAVQSKQQTGRVDSNALADATTSGLMTATPAAGRMASELGGTALETAGKVANVAKKITPKQAAAIVGGTSGAVAGHGIWSPTAAVTTADRAAALAEKVLGKDRANAPIFGRPPKEVMAEPPDATTGNKPYAGEDYNKFKAEPDATSPKQDYAGENWPKKPTSIAQVAKPDVDTAAYMQAVKENGGKIDASVSGRALEIKKSWAAQSPKTQASIPTPATVEPSPSSEAYQEAPTPEGTRVPGENEDLTNLLTKSVEKVKAPEYANASEAEVSDAKQKMVEMGYDPQHIDQMLKGLTGKAAPEPTVAPRARVEDQMGMSVDEQFRNHPAGPQPPFPQAAYEKALAGSDAIKNKLSSLKGVKVPREADLTPEEIGALMRKFHDQRTRFGY